MNLSSFFTYFQSAPAIAIFVLGWLSVYFVVTFTILIAKYVSLSAWRRREAKALNSFLMGASAQSVNSSLKKGAKGKICREKLEICVSQAEREATGGLVWLSIIASTSPFIGLFGTVYSILNTFSKMGEGNASLAVIAPAISEALVATGCGILVAIPAYTFHLLIKSKIYDLMTIIRREVDIVLLNASQAPQGNASDV